MRKNKEACWLQKNAEKYAELNDDDGLCYYVGFDETENVDIKPLLKDCYISAVKSFREELLSKLFKIMTDTDRKSIKYKDITNAINELVGE